MRFTVDKDALAPAVAWAANATPSKPTQPITNGVRIEADDGELRFTGTDYEITGRSSARADVPEEGVLVVPGRFFAKLCDAMPAGRPIEGWDEDGLLWITCGSAKFTMPLMPKEDYPTMPGMPDTVGTCVGADFGEAAEICARATSREVTLANLSGVWTEIGQDQITMVATDRYRLVVCTVPITRDNDQPVDSLLIPATMITGFTKAAGGGGKITLAAGGGKDTRRIGLGDGTRELVGRETHGQFPKWQNFIPQGSAWAAVINTDQLAAAVKRQLLTSEDKAPVTLTFHATQVTVTTRKSDGASGTEVIDDVAFEGDEGAQLRFGPHYLLDALAGARSRKVMIRMNPGMKPVVITAAGPEDTPATTPDPATAYQHVLVPMKAPV